MILGRIIFGIGSESLTVSQTSIVSIWFRNKELAFALSLNFSLPKLGIISKLFILLIKIIIRFFLKFFINSKILQLLF